MELGIRGLGRMGMGIARRLARAGHRVVAFDRKAEWMAEAQKASVIAADSLQDIPGLTCAHFFFRVPRSPSISPRPTKPIIIASMGSMT